MSLDVGLDMSSPEFKNRAYALYDRWRVEEPVHSMGTTGGQQAWLITRYDDAVEALKNEERFTKNNRSLQAPGEPGLLPDKVFGLINNNLLGSDPPDHTRLRSIVSKAFTPGVAESLRGQIEEITGRLIGELRQKGGGDLIDEFAFPLPIYVICQMLGIPPEDHALFRKWSDDFIAAATDIEKIRGVQSSLEAFASYVNGLIEERKAKPQADLITELIRVQENGDRLTREELSSTIFLLIVAGHETTVNLIGNGTLALLEHPDQLALWRGIPDLDSTAVEELLRFYGPVEISTNRWVREPFEWHGKQLQRGDLLFVSLASANRDPSQFEDPARLDLTRKKNRHIAFGSGIHFCLGAPLARLEGSIAISTLIRELPNLRFAVPREEIHWRRGRLMRGLQSLPVLV
ncbi:cytochrome P450 family protein [Paenibacillus mucilaginosus]|uniref:Cytochrome P450 n=1 Tax=Paenibacillus mucilaginosus (strain KNP414) TaxID=1036673 RepID=F8F5H3_PAEMK|nr:cytochrome P450 [Paenibacillus mucilaginosus]AEI41146.1 cytochrome P450 [Paenibacillus mucilaginosus KNP414]MCG7211424.1 cytochrome P450 [Paenibacillus mucilaginosus]WDM30198.1 cytochrome P450 [Paenibacillus mucilaginosus]